MAGNSFGHLFRIHTFGESHGPAIGVTIDGCPAGLEIDEAFINQALGRRKPGQSHIVSQRKESDKVVILSGVFEGKTTGTPIHIQIENEDQKSKDYSHIKDRYRPSHADYVYDIKYGHRDYRGGGRSSARETACRVAAGAIAQTYLARYGIKIRAYVDQIGQVKCPLPYTELDLSKVDDSIVRCPDAQTSAEMIQLVEKTKKSGNTVGGSVFCVVQNCPPGLGEPVFNKLHAALGGAILGINACKGFEIGSGFSAVQMFGLEHNDIFFKDDGGQIKTRTNHSGGIQGGITNGMDIYFRAAFKPVATVMRSQRSLDTKGEETVIQGKGRHDPCVVPRAVPIVEAMTALVIMDHFLLNKTAQL